MATRLAFTDRELLERLRETYPELSIYQMADIGEDEFVERYAEALQCDPWQARRVHRAAAQIKEQVALIWANLKDAVSPHLKQTLFNNIPPEFLEHLQAIPGYDRLFGSLDSIDCDHARSIFGPAAYFVDLMRFVETNITTKIPSGVSPELKLEQRRPDLPRIKLDKDNTYDLIPYIDLVIEMLEAVIRTKEKPDVYQIVEAAGFPMTLPFNLPLAEIRSYLAQLKTNLHDIYQIFRTAQLPADHLDREFLELSPTEYRLISTPITAAKELADYYGGHGLKPVFQLTQETLDDLRAVGLPASILADLRAVKNTRFEGPNAEQAFLNRLKKEIGAKAVEEHGTAILTWADRRLSKVQVFLAQTGLTRTELNELIYQDLDRHEINAGLSRLFFINNVDDGLGHLMIEQDPAYPHDPTFDTERLVNLSPQKLDRIYRFLKLARRLGWSFTDLDWAIRSLQPPYAPEPSLSFDGVNEYVACPRVNKTLIRGSFTLEAWVNPAHHGLNPIIAKGDAADQQNHQTHFLFWIDAGGRPAYFDKQLLDEGPDAYRRSLQSIPTGEFSHVAVTVASNKEVSFHINGKSATTIGPNTLPAAPATIGADLEIGRNLGECYFDGLIKEVRLWDATRTQAQLEANRYRRLTGRETHLVGYWPLLKERSGHLVDYSASGNHGLLGGDGFVTQPTWVRRDLVLDPMPVAMRFNGLDQYLTAAEVNGFDRERTTLTLEAWLKIIDLDRHNGIICQGSAADQKTQFLFGVNPDGELVFQSTSFSKGSSTDTGYKSKAKIKAQELTHVCVTLSEQAVTFYINGALDQAHTLAAPAKLQPQGRDLSLGRDFGQAYFSGLIKEVRVWDAARTVEQIVQDKDHPLTPYEPEGLIGYWQLDEIDMAMVNGSPRAVARDRSANQNHLHLGGVLEDYMPQPVNIIDLPGASPVATEGTLLEFDGENDVITIFDAENTGLGQFERWTLAFWFKPAVVDQPGRQQVLFIQGDTEAGLRIFIEEGLKIAVWSGDYEAPVLTESVIEQNGLKAGQWYHLAVTNNGVAAPDAVDLTAYLDGEPIGQITMAENFTFSPIGAAYLGGLGRTPGQTRLAGQAVDRIASHHLHYFAGQIADLRFWRVVKEAAEIKRERYGAPDPTAEDLVVYLPLDEGQGLTFGDQSRSHDPCLPPDHQGQFQTRNIALVNDAGHPDLENIYAHYAADGVDVLGWQNYVYTGRLRLTDADGGIGVTFYSRYPDRQASFYQLRRTEYQPTFHFTAQPYGQQTFSSSKTTSALRPAPDTWYRFKVEVKTGADETTLKAKLWPDGAVEPDAYDLEAVDPSANRLTSGTVGLWAFGPGEKQFDDLEVTINGQPQLLPTHSFEAYESGQDPTGWHDSSVRVYHDIEADLFRTHLVEPKRVLGTDSELTNIHAHYNPQDGSVDFESWSGYEYSGRMLLTDDNGGIGVTFFSQYPQGKDEYYRLRRSSRKRYFHLASHSARIGGNEDVDEMAISAEAKPNIWYRFRIRVQYNPDHPTRRRRKGATHIQAKVWEDGAPEPEQFEIDVFDASEPISSGAVGIWSMAEGSKYFDDLLVTPTSASGAPPLLETDFEQVDPGQQPTSWLSTGENNSRTEEPGLFRVMLVGNPVLGPGQHLTAEDQNLHTHYVLPGVDVLSWQNYVYTGRMYVGDETSGIGVTFYSRYPEQRDEYYRLRRTQERPAFHLSPRPEGIRLLGGDKANAEVAAEPDTWYRFYVEVNTVDDSAGAGQTTIRAKLWPDGDPEPAEFQIEAIDSSANRLTSGAVGVWADAGSPVYVDELQVGPELLLDEDFAGYGIDQKPVGWRDTKSRNRYELDDALFKTGEFDDNSPRWLTTDEYPLWLNPLAQHFDGQRHYLAGANLAGDPPTAFTIEAWVQPTVKQSNPILGQGHSLTRRPSFWFGLNQAGNLTLTGFDESGATYAVASSAEIPSDRFSHVAVSVDGASVSFYVAGQPDGDPQTLEPPVTLSGPDVEIGRNLADDQFGGYIREVRLWQGVRSPEQIAAGRYQSGARILVKHADDLIAYWPFLENEQGALYWTSASAPSGGLDLAPLPPMENLYAPDAADGHHLRRGGLAGARQPDLVDVTWQPEQGFWQPERLVLAFNGPNDVIHWQGSPTDDQRRRRTVALWFRVEDKTVSSRKQVLYHEGDEQRGLLIYLYAGCLYVGGYNGAVWPGTWLETDRIESGRWHQAAIVLDGRPDLRRGAFQAYLDGKLVDVGHGAQVGDYPHDLTLGGVAGPVRFHDGPTSATDAGHTFRGQMMELAIWNTTFTPEEISKMREAQLESKRASRKSKNLILEWQFEEADLAQKQFPNKAGGSQAVKINPEELHLSPRHSGLQPLGPAPVVRLPQPDLATKTLAGLARIKKLLQQYRLSMDRLTALWFGPKHIGREDRRPLFDQVFNAQEGADEPWSYYLEPMRWNVGGQGNLVEDRVIRSRLMGALRLSDQNLRQLAATLSGPEADLIVLDGAYLNRLYRLTNTLRTLQLNPTEFTRLLALLGLNDVDSMAAFLLLSEHLNRLNEIGLSVPVWDFLANDAQSEQASVRLDEAALRDFADELRSQSADFLATAESFVSDEINQFQSMQIFELLRQREVIDDNGMVTPEYATANDLAEMSRDPAWQADLTAMAVALNWRAELAADLAARPQWRLELYKALSDLGLTNSLSEQILQKLQGRSLILVNGLVLTESMSDADLRTAFAADRVHGPVKLPNNVSLSAIRKLLIAERAGQQAFLQAVTERLLAESFVDANGLVLKETLAELSDQFLRDLLGGGEPPGAHLLVGVRDALSRRKTIQDQLGGVLLSLRQAYDSAVLVALSTLLGAGADLIQVIIEHFKAEMPPARFLDLMLKLEDDRPVPAEIAAIPSPDTNTPPGYLYKLSKLLFLAAHFELVAPELTALLAEPATLDVKDALRPDLNDLDSLRHYRWLRQAFEDTEGKLLGLCQSEGRFSQIDAEARREQTLDDIAALTGWDRRQLGALVEHFGRAEDYNRVTGLSKLKQGFDLAQSMGADIEFLIQLADTGSLDYPFYRRQADALLNVLRAQYDEERWPKIYKPIRAALAVQKRDALLSLAMLKIPAEFEGRRSPDILSEYLLIDVQTGSEVDASRIQQAIAAVQFYVQRCQMNLERGVDPAWIPPEQWEWMKNYRVWEANRKVFLYPENYIEPELRDTKSPIFEELEQELMQSDINQASVEIAYTHYLDKFAEIANLKIAGSYLHQPLAQETNTTGDEILYLIGRTDSQPRIYYIRQRIKNEKGERWLPWNKIDLVIDSDFVSPVYAFGRLYIFWSEFRKLRKSAELRISPELIRAYTIDLINKAFANPYADFPLTELLHFLGKRDFTNYGKTLNRWFAQWNRQNQAKIAVSPELTKDQIKRFEKGEILLDSEGYLFSTKTELRLIEDFDVYDIAVKYSYYNFSKNWVPPQTYLEEKELRQNPLFDTTRLRVYPQRKLDFSQGTPVPQAPTPESETKVLEISSSGGIPNLQIAAGNMDRLTCSCWANFALNPGKESALTREELAAQVTLFDYRNGNLRLEASNIVVEIPGAIAAKEATKKALDQAKAAKADADGATSNAAIIKAQAVVDAARVGKDAVRDPTVREDIGLPVTAAQTTVDDALQEARQATIDAQTAAEQAVAAAVKAHKIAGSKKTDAALVAARAAAQEAANAKDAQEAVTAAQEAVAAARESEEGLNPQDRAQVKNDLDAAQAAVTAAQANVDAFVRKAKQAAAEAEAAGQAAYDHEAAQPNFESKGVKLSVQMRRRTQRDAAQEAAQRAAEAANNLDLIRTFKYAQDAIDAASSALGRDAPNNSTLNDSITRLAEAKAEQDIRKAVAAAKSAADAVKNNQSEPPASQEFTLKQYGWHHIAFTLRYQPSFDPNQRPSYVGALYHTYPQLDAGGAVVKDPDTQETRFISAPPQTLSLAGVDLLPGEGTSSAGALHSNSAFSAHMSEFRLWNLERRQEVITGERDERKRPNEFGLLLNLPLNGDQPGQKWVDAAAVNLPFVFKIVPAPIVPILDRERLVMFYGDQIKTLRNTIEDQNFSVTLDRNRGNQPTYDVDLALSKLYVAMTRGLSINDYATGRHSTLGQQYNAIESFRNADPGSILMTKLPQGETTLMDVNNQPGWYTLDTGDEQFLLKADRANLLTTEQRLSLPPAVATEPHETQTINIHFNPDSALQVGSAPPRFKVERLSTYAIHDLSKNLFTGGIDGLLTLESQQTGEFPFSVYEPNLYEPTKTPNGLIIQDGITQSLDFRGAYGPYYWEVFFHIPFLIANQLNANQNFADAQKWYHYIFDPTTRETAASGNEKDRYWRFLPFRAFSKEETLADLISNPAALAEYRADPFDPHAIARLRIFAYQKAVVMKYVDNLLDWGDSLFSQDTRESINEAVGLYILAYNLLGPRPKAKTVKSFKEIGDYAAIKEKLGGKNTPDFLVELDRQAGSPGGTGQAAVTPNSNLITSFCVPENEKFIGYWDRVEDRLYKIRHSLNIEGVFRQLALFEPPIDPAALVRAVASGRGIGGALSDLNVAVPHYRYSFMLEKAKEIAAGVIDLGSALLSAIESRDAEKLAILQNTHERNILALMTNVKQAELSLAKETLEALQISKENIDNRKKRYDDLVAKNLSEEEVAAGVLRGVAWAIKNGATTFKALEGVLGSLPEIESGASGIGGSPVATVKIHKETYTAGITAALEIALLLGEGLYALADATEKRNEYKRRLAEWKFEQKTAEFDQREIENQIGIAEIQIQMAERELSIHDKTIQQNREIEDFYRSKFANEALYNWMVSKLSGLYFQAYKLAYDMAKSAEKALQYELPSTENFISFGHWDSLKKGLLAGESLLLELNRMEKAHLEQDSRFLEIEKSISMRREMPGSLLALIAGGSCEFQLTEAMFDRDYPGHYFRVIKTIALSIKVEAAPYESVKATLIQVGSKALLEPSLDAVRYLMGDEGAEQPDGNVVRTNWRANQQIAISKTNEDYGMFVLNFFLDDRYFPFEGTGAISSWRLEMPHETNPDIDFSQIEDVIIHLRYTAKSDSGQFKEDVKSLIQAVS